MIAYHGTKNPDAVLREGLLCSKTPAWGNPPECVCEHVCLFDNPAAAAELGTVIAVDLEGLELPPEGFFNTEMRIHHDIPPDRLSLYPDDVEPDWGDWKDPFYATEEQQHPTCVRVLKEQGRWIDPSA